MNIRKATLQDIDKLIKLRFDYFKADKIHVTDKEENAIHKQLRLYFEKHITQESFIAILVEEDGEIASAGFLAISEKPASPSFITGYAATLLNVLTYPKFQRKGYATIVVKHIIEEAKQRNISVIDLSATAGGIELYRKLGFEESHYTSMRLKL